MSDRTTGVTKENEQKEAGLCPGVDRKERWNSLETSARQGFIGMGVSEGVSSLASMELNVCCEPTSGCSEAGA